MNFLDTNIIIRYLTGDDPEQAKKAKELLTQVETKKLKVTTCEGVIVEAVQVLSSKKLYNLPRKEIRTHLVNILRLSGLKILNKRAYLRALDLYATYPFLDFVDALNIAHMERAQIKTILSFDEDFDKIPGISRIAMREKLQFI